MRRPVVKEEIVDLDASASKASHQIFERIGRTFARKEKYSHLFLMKRLLISVFSWKPCSLRTFWKLGRLLVFSALLMAEHAPNAKITTIDRNPEMIGFC